MPWLTRSFDVIRKVMSLNLYCKIQHGSWTQRWWWSEFIGLFVGSGKAPAPAANKAPATPSESQTVNSAPPFKPAISPQPIDIAKQIRASMNSTSSNNYLRVDGQNTGNFITDQPATKVHSALGGGSSLGYLFGGGGN